MSSMRPCVTSLWRCRCMSASCFTAHTIKHEQGLLDLQEVSNEWILLVCTLLYRIHVQHDNKCRYDIECISETLTNKCQNTILACSSLKKALSLAKAKPCRPLKSDIVPDHYAVATVSPSIQCPSRSSFFCIWHGLWVGRSLGRLSARRSLP